MPLDDLHLSEAPNQIIRQWHDYGGWYNSNQNNFRLVQGIAFAGCGNSLWEYSSEKELLRHKRTIRHFYTLVMKGASEADIYSIFRGNLTVMQVIKQSDELFEIVPSYI